MGPGALSLGAECAGSRRLIYYEWTQYDLSQGLNLERTIMKSVREGQREVGAWGYFAAQMLGKGKRQWSFSLRVGGGVCLPDKT